MQHRKRWGFARIFPFDPKNFFSYFAYFVSFGWFFSRFRHLGFSSAIPNTGEVNARVNTAETFRVEVLNVSADLRDHSPYMPPVISADTQRQIRENISLRQSLGKQFGRSGLAASSLGPSSPSGFSTREPSEARLTSETSRISKDGISLFTFESCVLGTNIQGVPVRSPLSVCPDVKPYLTRPQVDSQTPGLVTCQATSCSIIMQPSCRLSRNCAQTVRQPSHAISCHVTRDSNVFICYVSDLLNLSRKYNTASFCNFSEHLLSAKAETEYFLPASLAVSLTLAERDQQQDTRF